MTSNDFEISLIQHKYICEYCNNNFTRKNNLNYHIKNKCKKKEKVEEERNLYKQQIEKLTNEIEKLKKNPSKKIINYNTLNNNNLTNINNIGKEKSSDLSHDEIRYIMSYGMDSVISLTEHLNFNEVLPCNHQTKYKNL
jgi:phage host-nuclease inhibitor protein Gam